MIKNILIINTLYYPYIGGGAEIICQEQAEELSKRGYSVSVLSTGNTDGIIKDNINNIAVYRTKLKNVYWHYNQNKPNKYIRMLWHLKDIYNWQMKKAIRQIIQTVNPNVVICHNITGFSIAVWDVIKEFNIPIIQVLHDQYLQCPNSNAFKNGKACIKQCFSCHLMRLPHASASNKVDAVVGVSQYVLTRLTNLGYFKSSKQYVIHNARQFENIPLKQPWNGKESLRIGYIGTLSKVKGIEWLIRSFMELNINATLTIAGKGESEEYENYLKKMASTDSRISFSGYVKSIDHYQQIHLSIIPSLWPDTFPTVAFESCAYHTPVIATNIGGIPEIIKNNINGILCNPKNTESIKQAIIDLYNHPEKLNNYIIQAKASVKEMTDLNIVLNSYINIIENCIKWKLQKNSLPKV